MRKATGVWEARQMTQPELIVLRPDDLTVRIATVDDRPFILRTWIMTQHMVYPNQYAHGWQDRTEQAIKDRLYRASTLVSHLDGDPGAVVSYIVYQIFLHTLVVQYAYTDETARRQGHISRMVKLANVQDGAVVFTHAPRNENAMRNISKRYLFEPSMWGQL